MKGTRVTSRYAKSLLLLATERGELDTVFADMKCIATTCSESRDLRVLLKSPIVKTDKKVSIIKAVFAGQLTELSDNFINIITRKKRESLIEGIAESFILQYKNFKHITSAEITSAVKLTEDQKQKIIGLLPKSSLSDNIEVAEKIDPAVIGGFVVRVGDVQIDSTILRRLNTLRKEFDDNLYVAEV